MVSDELKHAVEGMIDGAVLLDAERRILHYNDAYARLVGWVPRRLRSRVAEGVHCYDVMPLEVCQHECVGCRATEARTPLRIDGVRTTATQPQPESLELTVSATPLPGGFVLETYRDMTAEVRVQRRYREALRAERDANADLERAVAARTQELEETNVELKRAQAHLVQQEKMSSLGSLVAGVAHEINNPINFIVCSVPFLEQYVQAMEQLNEALDGAVAPTAAAAIDDLKKALDFDYLRTEAPSLLKSIRNGSNRAAAIVADLRTFSRGGDGTKVPVDVNTGLEATLNLIRPMLGKHTLKKDLHEVPPVLGDAGQLNQVFMNLLTNAVQALAGKEGEVLVRTRIDGDQVRIDVSDTGVGIPEANRRRIFDPFFTTKALGTGTGLGLSISYGVVERHGGRMLVESEEGRGSTFSVLLPRTR